MAYITATIITKEAPAPDGTVHLVVSFTGNAGETPVTQDYYIGIGSTALALKQWRDGIITALNNKKTLAAAVNVNDVIPAAPAPPGPSAQDVWIEKAARLARMKALPVTNASATSDINTLQSDVNATYQAGYIAGV